MLCENYIDVSLRSMLTQFNHFLNICCQTVYNFPKEKHFFRKFMDTYIILSNIIFYGIMQARFIFKYSSLMKKIRACMLTYVNFDCDCILCYISRYKMLHWASLTWTADKIFRIHASRYSLPSIDNMQFLLPSCVLGVNRYLDPVVVYATYLRFPSRPNKISVEQRGSEESAETGSVTRMAQHPDVSACKIRLRKNARSKSQAGGCNYIRINSITSAYDAPRVNECAAAAHFLISGASHISRRRRQSADLVLAPSLSLPATSRILFSNGGFFASRDRRRRWHLDAFRRSVIILGRESEKLFPPPIDSSISRRDLFTPTNLLTSPLHYHVSPGVSN